jgi:long-chain acyl-CoA synthetase
LNNFWNFEKFKENIAILTEDDKITYSELSKRVNQAEIVLKKNPYELVFLKCKNDINSIVNYLAALRTNCPVLLLDEDIDEEHLQIFIKNYNPRFLLDNNTSIFDSNTICSNNLAVLLSTSGSTGNPKLVRLSRTNIQNNAAAIAEYLSINQNDRAITSLPFHYSYGLSVINSHLINGASVILTNESIISKKWWDLIKKYKATSFAGVPYTFDMLKKLRFENMDLPSLRYITQAGGKLSEEQGKYFTELCQRKNIDFFIMYGQTEASPRMTYFKTNDFPNKINSIGKAIPGGKISLFDDKKNIIKGAFMEGELIYYGSNVMMGYAKNKNDLKREDDLKNILHTGDIAFFDDEGFFFITGRKNRFTKIQGLRINLDDINQFLLKQNINAVAIGNDLQICIASTNTIDEKMKKRILKKYKLHHSVLRFLQIDEIPKNSSGKILYKKIEDMFNDQK